jgi:hypothetical protein
MVVVILDAIRWSASVGFVNNCRWKAKYSFLSLLSCIILIYVIKRKQMITVKQFKQFFRIKNSFFVSILLIYTKNKIKWDFHCCRWLLEIRLKQYWLKVSFKLLLWILFNAANCRKKYLFRLQAEELFG